MLWLNPEEYPLQKKHSLEILRDLGHFSGIGEIIRSTQREERHDRIREIDRKHDPPDDATEAPFGGILTFAGRAFWLRHRRLVDSNSSQETHGCERDRNVL